MNHSKITHILPSFYLPNNKTTKKHRISFTYPFFLGSNIFFCNNILFFNLKKEMDFLARAVFPRQLLGHILSVK